MVVGITGGVLIGPITGWLNAAEAVFVANDISSFVADAATGKERNLLREGAVYLGGKDAGTMYDIAETGVVYSSLLRSNKQLLKSETEENATKEVINSAANFIQTLSNVNKVSDILDKVGQKQPTQAGQKQPAQTAKKPH